MIETINDVCRVLSAETVTIDDVVAVTGHSPTSSGIHSTSVQPNNTGFSRIVIETKSDIPSSVQLTLADDATLGLLREALGDYRHVPRIRPEDSASVAFSVDTEDTFTCTIFAYFDPLTDGSDNTRIESLLIRRDLRL